MARRPDDIQSFLVDMVEVPDPQAALRLRRAFDLVLAAAARLRAQVDSVPLVTEEESEAGTHAEDQEEPS